MPLALGPIAAVIAQLGNYVLAARLCSDDGRVAMTILALAMAAVTTGLIVWLWRPALKTDALHGERTPQQSLATFMARVGLLLNVLMTLFIIAMAVPPVVLRDCH
jgi:hypothetical protein